MLCSYLFDFLYEIKIIICEWKLNVSVKTVNLKSQILQSSHVPQPLLYADWVHVSNMLI